MGTIVVGVDGSKGSTRALRWALDEGRLRGDAVRVVHAFHRETFEDNETLAQQAAAVLDEALSDAGDKRQDVTVRTEAIRDRRPAHALVELSADADLLVVGSRGLGGFSGLLLGSVGQQVVHHARCPVVVIPPVEPVALNEGHHRLMRA